MHVEEHFTSVQNCLKSVPPTSMRGLAATADGRWSDPLMRRRPLQETRSATVGENGSTTSPTTRPSTMLSLDAVDIESQKFVVLKLAKAPYILVYGSNLLSCRVIYICKLVKHVSIFSSSMWWLRLSPQVTPQSVCVYGLSSPQALDGDKEYFSKPTMHEATASVQKGQMHAYIRISYKF